MNVFRRWVMGWIEHQCPNPRSGKYTCKVRAPPRDVQRCSIHNDARCCIFLTNEAVSIRRAHHLDLLGVRVVKQLVLPYHATVRVQPFTDEAEAGSISHDASDSDSGSGKQLRSFDQIWPRCHELTGSYVIVTTVVHRTSKHFYKFQRAICTVKTSAR